MIRAAYQNGAQAALAKFALAPPTQVDEFVANIEQGKDVPPAAPAQMSHPPALDGTSPLNLSPMGC